MLYYDPPKDLGKFKKFQEPQSCSPTHSTIQSVPSGLVEKNLFHGLVLLTSLHRCQSGIEFWSLKISHSFTNTSLLYIVNGFQAPKSNRHFSVLTVPVNFNVFCTTKSPSLDTFLLLGLLGRHIVLGHLLSLQKRLLFFPGPPPI